MKILVIAPHADDEILGCGGVIAKHIANGNEVKVLVVTKGAEELYSEAEVQVIRNEAKIAHEYLGISETLFFDFPAPILDQTPSYKISNAVTNIIKTYQPEVVYLPHRGDLHKDHRMVFESSLVAIKPVNNCSVKHIYCYETLSETEWGAPFGDDAFIPNVFEDITDYIELKKEAMRKFESQVKEFPHSRSLVAIDALAKFRGATVGKHAAEAFMLIRSIN
ncbi:N-acetyl-alpha-D-glucosaminyl L-malate deacetylase 1 [Kordia sp. SMS9]|uniref:PIG-L deacetylase family protein n=1 Tax=Kordia sp. SMS9 TaxID=2282170 RepID=UPI000E0DA96A|nr:PIG-L deacetylase family protein [Kordia sp. SMS9]AXG68980.1 N-acetyl-alpha-D-glucosaminyl L-malate deacetylase 1 [Kordia sp. SMS9]